MGTHHSNTGFSLIELMVALAVAGILVTIGTSVSSTYSKQRMFHQQVTWIGGQLTYARSVARTRSVQVDVRLQPGTQGQGQALDMFEDNNGNGIYDNNAERSLLVDVRDPPRLDPHIIARPILDDGTPEPFSDTGPAPAWTIRFDHHGRCLAVPDPSGQQPDVTQSPFSRRILEFSFQDPQMPYRLRVEVSNVGVVSYPLPP